MTDVMDKLSDAEWEAVPAAQAEPTSTPSDGGVDQTDYMSLPAPYGRFKNGRPRKTPPGGKAATSRSKKKAGTDYASGIMGLFQMAAFGLSMAAGDKNVPLLADSVVISQHGPNVAQALDALAQERPEVAAVLDKVLAVGPYGLVLGALAPMVIQIASNHGVKIPGVPSAQELVSSLEPAAA
jgi:hypothetical protein